MGHDMRVAYSSGLSAYGEHATATCSTQIVTVLSKHHIFNVYLQSNCEGSGRKGVFLLYKVGVPSNWGKKGFPGRLVTWY